MNNGFINGHEYVDLGLSVKWATCNVGASRPEDEGDHFAYGETQPKNSYGMFNCKTWNLNIKDIGGDSKYDTARANWGGTWRLPTKTELDELINKCTWQWVMINFVDNGFLVTGNNGNTIYLPNAGLCIGGSYLPGGGRGYWTSSSQKDNKAYHLKSPVRGNPSTACCDRCYGLTIRPVSK